MIKPGQASFRSADTVLALGLVGLLCVLLVPLPPMLLDILLVVNLSFSILVLLLVLSSERPLDLSTFPTLLLFSSLLRLALNVASTRLILLHGQAGDVIQSFGEFVVGGSVVVGVVVFLILVVIQFVVITKGAGRISEVAARFTLDAMPGKQLAIDADVNAGLITPEDAKHRRAEITREAEFYGAMDGASKFVRGDAIAGIIITAVNILGGVSVAFLAGMDLSQAFKTYTILTVGDGLVSQIPALIVATAGAIIVTKASSETNLADELSQQITDHGRGLQLAAGIVAVLGCIPGLPLLPFLFMAVVMIGLSRLGGPGSEAPPGEEIVNAESAAAQQSEELQRLLRVDQMGIELGYRLLYLVEKTQGGGLLKHISQLRKRFATELGLLVPPIRVTDNVRLPPSGYRIMIQGEGIASGELRPGNFLAMNPGNAEDGLDGEDTREPTFGLPAVWIPEHRRSEADLKGYTIVEPISVLVTHLSEIIRSNAGEILTRDDVKALVEAVREERPAVVDDLIPNQLTYGDVHRTLRSLLAERVSIRNLGTIMEVLSEHAGTTKDPEALAEMVRQRMARSLVEPYLDSQGNLKVVTLDPTLERSLVEVARNQELPEGPGVLRAVVEHLGQEVLQLVSRGQEAVVLVRGEIRTFLRDLMKSIGPRTVVLSYAEAAAAHKVEPIAVVSCATGKEA